MKKEPLTQESREELQSNIQSGLEDHLDSDPRAVGYIIVSADEKGIHESFGIMGYGETDIVAGFISAMIGIGNKVDPHLTKKLINSATKRLRVPDDMLTVGKVLQ